MFVIKRNGEKESVKFDKITRRLEKLLYDIKDIDATLITQKICNRIFPGITTTELDNLASQVCMSMITENPNFGTLGSRIVISNHQKNTDEDFLEVVKKLKNNTDMVGNPASLVSDEFMLIVNKHSKEIQNMIVMERDYLIDFFGFKTLEKSYLLKVNKKIVERPQHLFMRVAIGIHGNDLENVKKTYDNISLKNYTHATPTLFNASSPYPQMSSCYLSATEDSIEGIFGTISDCAKISKWAGGIGIHISNIRAKDSYIRKTGGNSDGIVPMLKLYNDTARYINQSGKRNGSFAIYLEPWHADVFSFLDAKKNHGAEEERARDLFYALWVPDLFMEKVEKNEEWYLMCPDKCPGLPDVYGEDFNKLYNKYIEEEKYNKKINARDLWDAVISSQVETGTPYILYKDAANKKSNQQNIGTIKSSNLCVSGDTTIQIKQEKIKNIPIKELVDTEVEVWNGKQWSKTIIRKTGENQKLLKIIFSNSVEIKCTEYHKFYIQENDNEVIYEAKNLKTDMKIIPFMKWTNTEFFDSVLTKYYDISITEIQECIEEEDTFCFNEPLEHKGIFNGIITGQCAEIIEVSNKDETAVCNLASICLQNLLEYPQILDFSISHIQWLKLLNEQEKKLFKLLESGNIKIFTTEVCSYCKLLKAMLKRIGLTYEEVDAEEAEKLRIMSEPSLSVVKPFETVPQLFVVRGNVVNHIGGHDDCWTFLKPKINYKKLHELAYDLTINLNKIIDKNFYPIEKTRVSNMKHRPIGIGVQGLADLFIKIRLPFDSEEAMKINKELFETIYHGAMEASIELAKRDGIYETYEGSPLSKGLFQFDLWGLKENDLSGLWDWKKTREDVLKHGVRNSLLLALMPTASTSQIMGSNECFEPFTSNIYTRRTLAGEFTVVNKYLMQDLIDLDIWNEENKDRLIYDKGSVKHIKGLPTFLKNIYKTVWEISQKNLIKMSADRGPYICQSQSLNLFFEKPSFNVLTSAHLYGWKLGLKTGSYYIRSKPAVSSQRFGFDAKKEKEMKEREKRDKIEDEGCLTCSA